MPEYVNNKQLYACILKYKEKVKENERLGKPKPQIPNEAAIAITQIAERLGSKHRFRDYTYLDEMISDAIMACIQYFDSFNPEKSNNPFAYFTQVVKMGFFNRLNKESKQQYVKARIYRSQSDAISESEDFNSDSIDKAIISFEDSLERKKNRAEERKKEKADREAVEEND